MRDNKELAKIAVELSAYNICYVSNRLKSDEDLFFLVMGKNNWYLNYTSKKIRNRKDIIRKILMKNKFIFPIINTELKKDKNFMIEVINDYGISLYYIPKQLQSDIDILKATIRKNSFNFFHIPLEIFYKKNIIRQLFHTNPSISNFFTHSIHKEILDEYNYKCLLIQKRKEEKNNIFHMDDICFYIEEFLVRKN